MLSRTISCFQAVWLCLALAGSVAQPGDAQTRSRPYLPEIAIEPRARAVIDRMREAYANLDTLEQRTEFFSAVIPFTPGETPYAAPKRPDAPRQEPERTQTQDTAEGNKKTDNTEVKLERSILLQAARANRFRLELTEKVEEKQSVHQWVCDGKHFYSYIPDKNWYTQEKAPGQLAAFRRLTNFNANSFEVQLLVGINPFEEMRGQVDAIQYAGTERVRGIETEVLLLRNANRFEETSIRLYVGKEDALIRRVVTETIPVVGPNQPGKIGDPLDELVDTVAPTPPVPFREEDPALRERPVAPVAVITRITYENTLTPRPNFDFRTFVFTPPPNALLYGPPPSAAQRRRTMLENLKAIQRDYYKTQQLKRR